MIKPIATTVAVITAGVLVAAGAASATPAPTLRGGGYLVSPATLHTAGVAFRVPALSCGVRSPTRTVRLGLFGATHSKSGVAPFDVVVQASCRGGADRYVAGFLDDSGFEAGFGVHAGDRIRLTLGRGLSFEADDETSGAGFGGEATGNGETLDRHVLIGAQTVGARPHRVRVGFDSARVNGSPISRTAHHRQGRTSTTHVASLAASGAGFMLTLT